jgi:phospholipid transport system transporter-binding protein
MSHPQWQVQEPGLVYLSGNLDREQVPALWRDLQQWQPGLQQVTVSLKSVNRVDSAGMVLLIHLIEHAKSKNCHIMFDFVPAQLRTLFQLSNVNSVVAQHIKE